MIYKICVFVLGALPATFWFFLGSYYSFFLFNNITNYFVWAIFYLASFMGALAFWIELFLKNKISNSRIFVPIMMMLGIIATFCIYFSEPSFFKELTLVVFLPVIAAILVIGSNMHNKLLNATAKAAH